MPRIEPGVAAAIVARTLDEAATLHQRVRERGAGELIRAAAAVRDALAAGHKVLAFGNGGSAADAQHLTTELVGRFLKDRIGFAAVALTADSSLLTSVANDYGFDRIFARQVEALGRAGDVAFAITTSGSSPNVVRGLEAARERGLRTVALTGKYGGDAGRVAEIHINVPDDRTPRVQEVHIALIHALCEIVEGDLE